MAALSHLHSALARVVLAALASLCVLGACDRAQPPAAAVAASAPPPPPPPAAASHPTYDEKDMVFGAPAAVVTSERHTGTFSLGSALSTLPAVKPLDPAPVKEIRLDTTHKIIDLAPGVKFSAWTFGDQVPGPVLRARVGDRIKFTMTNRSDEAAPGVRLTAAPMMHSMDFHAAMVAPNDKYRSIAPGQTISFEFTLNYPGVFMYHCGTPMVLEHIASGMYGMVIVEPRGGYPTQVDREYAIIQSEFYTKPDPDKRKVDGVPLQVLDTDRVRAKAPTYTVFNGRYNGLVETPLQAKPNERVRLFVMNVGPSNTSSFHVVGTIFDRVWIDGNPDNQFRGMQTVLLGSSSGAIVEFKVPEAGNYAIVDHHFANASQGAVGTLAAGAPPGSDAEHHNIPATAAPTDPAAQRGKLAFESKCLACHTIGGGDRLGPDLFGVTKRHDEGWLTRWLKSPEQMLQSDATAKALLDKYKVPMPNQGLGDPEIKDYLAYFRWADANLQPQGAQQPQAATAGQALPPSATKSAAPMPGGQMEHK
ncbi:multicopper oxidase domain-containing protein [Ramlibacter sp. G-1-2-2]|uniref:Multicopper oxidase domain-containing protein n=1 Tax=Ramlibacter agri TaxID=2728837 RepID=A0A848H6R6_9BURK|nr:multicopper oxidase domain-containing protein [Ramlibacter agri]NML45209.1 multicopper oxidase domain-containing protein [Ramlibacter agri]